jgi:uncharacterized membrane protein YedE/YeeE
MSTVASIGREGARTTARRPEAPWNPYVAGFGLGLVLLAAFVIMGRGLGATGTFSAVLVWLLSLFSVEYVTTNPVHAGYWNDGQPLAAWLVFLTLGCFVGAAVSGRLAHRTALVAERGPRIGVGARFAFAFAGGALMGVGAKLASGCTSGQALTGGALLNVGSWAFMIAVFVGGYAVAYPFRRLWR